MGQNCGDVEKNSIKILSLLGSNSNGGAENFFDRLILSLNKRKEIDVHAAIRKNKNRFQTFRENKINVNKINFLNIFSFITHYNLNKICRKFNPDIIFTMMNRASSMLRGISESKAKKIARLGGYYKLKYYTHCDYLIANTPNIKEYLILNGWDKNKVIYLPNFAQENKSIKKLRKRNENNFILLGVGRFHENKNFEILVKALKYLRNCQLWLVGSGKFKKHYLALAQNDNTINKLKIFDWTEKIQTFYSKADILVCPSRIEPLGNIILEGWYHKIPIIASDASGPNYLINHGFNGLKFKNDNQSELVFRIKELMKDYKKSKILIKNGYSTYQKKYSEKIVTQKYLDFFKKVI